jgi:hypothetical protein
VQRSCSYWACAGTEHIIEVRLRLLPGLVDLWKADFLCPDAAGGNRINGDPAGHVGIKRDKVFTPSTPI